MCLAANFLFHNVPIERNLGGQDDFILEQLILVSYVQLRADYFTKTGSLSLQRMLSF